MAEITSIGTVEFPIWKDIYAVIPVDTEEYVGYRYRINSNYVYQGYTYATGDSGNYGYIFPKKVLKDYVTPTMDFDVDGIQNNNAHVTAYVTASLDSFDTETDYATFKSYYDWSYQENTDRILSDPIIPLIDPKQRFVCSVIKRGSDSAFNSVGVSFAPTGSNTYTPTNYINTINIQVPLNANTATVTAGNDTLKYTVRNTCKPYCLYYLNQRGGWDSMVFQGKIVESATNKINQYKREYNNLKRDFNTVDYLKQKTRKWKLTTDFLTDAQSKKMCNILDTTMAYLHDFNTDKIIPVNVTNNSYDVKTYRNQNRKFFTYTVEVSASQMIEIK